MYCPICHCIHTDDDCPYDYEDLGCPSFVSALTVLDQQWAHAACPVLERTTEPAAHHHDSAATTQRMSVSAGW
jgi:hypothetical protein